MGTVRLKSSDHLSTALLVWFVILTVWWLYLQLSHSKSDPYLLFGAVYGTTTTLFGAVVGLKTASHWGGFSSMIGKSITFLSLGLLAQTFGQAVFSFYNLVFHIEIPYPSLADIGYFGTIPLYILGAFYLGASCGIKIRLREYRSQIAAIVIPGLMLATSYILILSHSTLDLTEPLETFLNLAYPLGQAMYVSMALVIYHLSRNFLGGTMRTPIRLILIGFIAQYVADSNFLIQSINLSWKNGGYGDYLYLIAYVFMSLGLILLRSAYQKIKSGD